MPMNDASTLLTIVVPTKNRPHTAGALVESLLTWPGRDFQIAVQDCSDDDRLTRSLERFAGDERLDYQHSGRPVSMTENWNLAMARVRGEYTIIIGDDDGCGDRVINAARWALANDIDAILWTRNSRYYWPDYPVSALAGLLVVDPCSPKYEELDLAAELIKASYGHGNRIHRLPMAYHGLIRTRRLHDLRDSTGTWFKGLTPDYYSAYALAGYVRTAVHFEFPFSILGSCSKSNAAKTARLMFRKAPSEHIDEYSSVEWPEILPDLRLMTSLLAESMITGLQSAQRKELIRNLDLAQVYADYLYDHPLAVAQIISRYLGASRFLGRDRVADLVALARRLPSVVRTLTRQDLRNWIFTRLRRETANTHESATRHAATTIGEAARAHDQFFRPVAAALPF